MMVIIILPGICYNVLYIILYYISDKIININIPSHKLVLLLLKSSQMYSFNFHYGKHQVKFSSRKIRRLF